MEPLEGNWDKKMCHASSAVFRSLSGHYLPQELHLMTTKLGQSQSNEGGNDNEKGQRENATWQPISIDRKTKTDKREKANLCGGKHHDRAMEGKTRRKEWHQAEFRKTASVWDCVHPDNILIYNGASILNPSGVEAAHRRSEIMQLVEIFPELF